MITNISSIDSLRRSASPLIFKSVNELAAIDYIKSVLRAIFISFTRISRFGYKELNFIAFPPLLLKVFITAIC